MYGQMDTLTKSSVKKVEVWHEKTHKDSMKEISNTRHSFLTEKPGILLMLKK